LKKLILSLIFLLLFLAGCAAPPAPEAEYVLTYAENQPQNYPSSLGGERFAELVRERTDGKVVIQVKYAGEYGTDEDVLEQMRFGGIDFSRVSLAILADEVPILNALQMPFLYRDGDHMWRVLDSELGQELLQATTDTGVIGLSWYDAGARSFYSTSPIHSLEDMAGLRVRTQNSGLAMDMVEHLGAVPVYYDHNDVHYAFETRRIAAAENNWPVYQYMEHYQVAKYYTVVEHTRIPDIQIASAVTWEVLPEEYREIIVQCAAESAEYQRNLWIRNDIFARAAVIDSGCEIIFLEPEQKQAFLDAAEPLYEAYCGDYLDLIRQIRES
jgi:tripartite ATP-independent transporter DctP family solute receptor